MVDFPLGELAAPQPGAPAQGAPPTTPQDFEEKRSKWLEYLGRPEVSAGLMQLGVSLLTPNQGVGPAVGQAAEAVGRVGVQRKAEEDRQRGIKTDEEKLGLEKRRVTATERGTEATITQAQAAVDRAATLERNATTAAAKADATAQRLEAQTTLDRANLALRERKQDDLVATQTADREQRDRLAAGRSKLLMGIAELGAKTTKEVNEAKILSAADLTKMRGDFDLKVVELRTNGMREIAANRDLSAAQRQQAEADLERELIVFKTNAEATWRDADRKVKESLGKGALDIKQQEVDKMETPEEKALKEAARGALDAEDREKAIAAVEALFARRKKAKEASTSAPAMAPALSPAPTDPKSRVVGQVYSAPDGRKVKWTGTGWEVVK